MKKTLLIIVGIIILLYFLNSLGFLKNFNRPINNLIAGKPDFSCQVDQDCKLDNIDCGPCRCPQAVNKNWEKFCPFKSTRVLQNIYCEPCPPNPKELECVNNQCQKKQ